MAVSVLPESLRRQCLVLAVVLTTGLAVPSWLAAESRPKAAPGRKAAVSAPRNDATVARALTPPSKRQAVREEAKKKKSSEARARKSTRRSKISKRHQSSKPDLAYHGIIYRPQRYDPSRGDRRTGGAPNPHAGELVHDHFLELDRNRDGSIDPIERTFGRLDLDHDLINRRWN